MKKRLSPQEEDIVEIVTKLADEGKSEGESTYALMVLVRLTGIDISLGRICFVLSVLLGCEIGKLIAGLF